MGKVTAEYVFINGDVVPSLEGKVSIFDRGFLFADAVYEVVAIIDSKLLDADAHLYRLKNSLSALRINYAINDAKLIEEIKRLVEINEITEGLVYIQISRGVAPRSFEYPKAASPTVVMFTTTKNIVDDPVATNGIRIITLEDIRWHRRNLKTVGLLAACMCKQEALDAGVDDAWLVESENIVTEGTSSNAFILNEDNVLVTRQLGYEILPGITRRAVLELAKEQDIRVDERPFSVEEIYSAKEAFITSATSLVTPVIEVNGKAISDGKPGAYQKN